MVRIPCEQAVLNYQEYVTRHSDVDLVNYWRTNTAKLEFILDEPTAKSWYQILLGSELLIPSGLISCMKTRRITQPKA